MIASTVFIHVVIRLSDVPSRGKWSTYSLTLPVMLFVCSLNGSISHLGGRVSFGLFIYLFSRTGMRFHIVFSKGRLLLV